MLAWKASKVLLQVFERKEVSTFGERPPSLQLRISRWRNFISMTLLTILSIMEGLNTALKSLDGSPKSLHVCAHIWVDKRFENTFG